MLPILLFHALEEAASSLALPPARFRQLLAWFRGHGYRAQDLAEAAGRLEREAPAAGACVITFDDGYASVYREAFPALAEHGFTATVFLTTGRHAPAHAGARLPSMQGRPMLSWSEIREMHRAGIRFGAHTLTHPDLTRLDAAAVEAEVEGSRALIADALGVPVPCFAYPFGRHDARTRAVAARLFTCACSDALGLATPRSDRYALPRVEMYYFRSPLTTALLAPTRLRWYLRARRGPRALRRAARGVGR